MIPCPVILLIDLKMVVAVVVVVVVGPKQQHSLVGVGVICSQTGHQVQTHHRHQLVRIVCGTVSTLRLCVGFSDL